MSADRIPPAPQNVHPGGAATISCLLPPLAPDVVRLLASYGRLLDKVRPLSARHRRTLAGSVRRLSQQLTDERGQGFAPKYMSEAEGLNAYMRYFLPWNLYRQARLLSGLGSLLPTLEDGSVVADLGSGPLTAVQALWLARPELRQRRLTFICLDRAQAALRAGRELFEALAPESPWRITLIQGGVTERLPEKAKLVVAANVLNEYPLRPGDEAGLDKLALALAKNAAADGRLLLIEPGTRAGGRMISSLRGPLMEHGLYPAAPCTHGSRCPMPGVGRDPWCHFAFSTADAPGWLTRLSTQAGLAKERASLSFLLAAPQEQEPDPALVRVISGPLDLSASGDAAPGGVTMGRYGCAQAGLVVLTGGVRTVRATPSGCLLRPQWPENPARDGKSGGAIVPLADIDAPRFSPAGVRRRVGANPDEQMDIPTSTAPRAVGQRGGMKPRGRLGQPSFGPAPRGGPRGGVRGQEHGDQGQPPERRRPGRGFRDQVSGQPHPRSGPWIHDEAGDQADDQADDQAGDRKIQRRARPTGENAQHIPGKLTFVPKGGPGVKAGKPAPLTKERTAAKAARPDGQPGDGKANPRPRLQFIAAKPKGAKAQSMDKELSEPADTAAQEGQVGVADRKARPLARGAKPKSPRGSARSKKGQS